MKYEFRIKITDIDATPFVELETMSGVVEASRYSHACTAAWPLITEKCNQYRAQGQNVGVGDLLVQRQEENNG